MAFKACFRAGLFRVMEHHKEPRMCHGLQACNTSLLQHGNAPGGSLISGRPLCIYSLDTPAKANSVTAHLLRSYVYNFFSESPGASEEWGVMDLAE